jgi:hypothetical protein
MTMATKKASGGPVRQHYSLATGKGANTGAGGKPSAGFKKGGKAKGKKC